ncbi:hypothetical protein ABNG02_16560 [Halorubrum ejinorense]|uniref:Uncharacterized protein n=1 Tax=Halorubrum ejinorense TaxID=425309 RepID=A0AAV3SSI2_9EURY
MTDSETPTAGDDPAGGGGSADGDDAERDCPEQDDAERDGEAAERDEDTAHLDGVRDGAGCTEIWERLSESRKE